MVLIITIRFGKSKVHLLMSIKLVLVGGRMRRRYMFGCDEVSIIAKFGDRLPEWADVEIVEAFLRKPTFALREDFVQSMPWDGDTMLTKLFLKSVIFKMEEGFDWEADLESIGVVLPEKKLRLVSG